jgi:pyruvate dehydrogenase E2 component (dihydrolipoamide acetyltransferase)
MQDEGVLAKRLVPAQGAELKVGEPIALIVEDADAYKQFLALSPDAVAAAINSKGGQNAPAPSAPSSSQHAAATTAPAQPAAASHQASTGPKRLSPAARHIAESKGVDVSKVVATAFNGEIISKGDVLNAIKSGNVNAVSAKSSHQASTSSSNQATVTAQPAQPTAVASSAAPVSYTLDLAAPVNNRYKDILNNNMRKVIAKRLTESKSTVPHLYVSTEIEIDALLSLRKTLKKDMDINVSVNDVVIRAAALALRDMPAVNSKWNSKTLAIEESAGIDISVAVATPNGLITPIVKGADRRGLVNISQVMR